MGLRVRDDVLDMKVDCPNCQIPMNIKVGRYGHFFDCRKRSCNTTISVVHAKVVHEGGNLMAVVARNSQNQPMIFLVEDAT